MTTLTLTAKGQVTLNKKVQAHLGVRPGQKIDLEEMPDGRLVIRAAPKRGDISEVFGLLKNPNGPRLTIEQIKELTEKAWARES